MRSKTKTKYLKSFLIYRIFGEDNEGYKFNSRYYQTKDRALFELQKIVDLENNQIEKMNNRIRNQKYLSPNIVHFYHFGKEGVSSIEELDFLKIIVFYLDYYYCGEKRTIMHKRFYLKRIWVQ